MFRSRLFHLLVLGFAASVAQKSFASDPECLFGQSTLEWNDPSFFEARDLTAVTLLRPREVEEMGPSERFLVKQAVNLSQPPIQDGAIVPDVESYEAERRFFEGDGVIVTFLGPSAKYALTRYYPEGSELAFGVITEQFLMASTPSHTAWLPVAFVRGNEIYDCQR
jgi:hypothetical protein